MQLSETAAFLRCVLPAEGYYCAVIFDTPHPRPGIDLPRQPVFETIDELAAALLANDAAGRTVYHACASFKDPRGVLNERKGKYEFRSHANAARVKSLWLDVDAGPGKPYPDASAAAAAVSLFVHSAGLPNPIYVGSGSGIHIYLPLEHAIAPDLFSAYAAGLKALCARYGLIIDPVRTGDISSILRPPGTHNRKHGNVSLVRSGPQLDPYPNAHFEFLRTIVAAPTRRNVGEDTSIISRIANTTSYTAVYADPIADRCEQISAFRASGRIAEPYWYACLGVLSRCEDGEVKAHEWSQRDFPGYSPNETQAKYERTKQLSGATTCAKLNDVNPGVCGRCAFQNKITSPISVGGSFPLSAAVSIPADDAQSIVQLPLLPEPFRWSQSGQLIFITENPQGIYDTIIVAENPVFLDSVQTGELDRGAFSYKFRKHLPQDGWSDAVVDANILHSAQGIATLAGRGVNVHDPKLFLSYVRHAVDEFHAKEPLHTRYDQFGWKHEGDTSFLFGEKLYTPVGPVSAIGAKEVTARCQFLGPRKNGNLLAWTEAADSLFAKDLEALSATVLASFAAPLMKFQAANEGGAILHLYTDQSGRGKSTALQGAWTVWGEKYGLNLTNDDTKVSKPIALGVLGNLPVIYDELGDKDPEVIKRFVVMFTEGRDRMRGDPQGGIRHTKATWQTVLLSAANNSLLDLLTGQGTDAPSYRVLELTANLQSTMDKARADRLKQTLDNNAGHAGDAYLRYLLHPDVLNWTRRALNQWTGDIWDATKLGTEYRFRVRLVGAIAVAASLVNKLDILHFQTDRIVSWLIQELKGEHQSGGISGIPTIDRAVSAFGQFLNEHYGQTLAVPDRWKPKAGKMMPLLKPQHTLAIRYEVASQRVFISAQTFRDWCIKKQMSPRHILTVLKDHDVILDYGRNVTLSAGTDIPGAQTLCIEANAAHPVMSGLVQIVQQAQGNVQAAQ